VDRPHRHPAIDVLRDHGPRGRALTANLSGRGAIESEALGATVRLSDGREVLDFGSYAVAMLGHRPAEVVEAVEHQLRRLPTSTHVLANEAEATFNARLVNMLNPSLTRIWTGSSGADVIEAALKLARLRTGRMSVLGLVGGYHGKSLGALAVTHNDRYRQGLEPLLAAGHHVPFERNALLDELTTGRYAAFVFEPVQGEGGVQPLTPSILREAIDVAHAHGTMAIADEIQCGMGRAGCISLSEEWELPVDAIAFGKVLGGGVMPLSALACNDELFDPLQRDPFRHSMTFSGHPLSCAAGVAAMDLIQAAIPKIGEVHRCIAAEMPRLLAVTPDFFCGARGRGLMWGLETVSAEAAGFVLAELAPRGLITSPCLSKPDVIRLLPPVLATSEQITSAFDVITSAVEVARGSLGLAQRDTCHGVNVAIEQDEGGSTWFTTMRS